MRYFRCKCGEKSAWSSMGVALCYVCPKCKSTLAESPQTHQEPELHNFEIQYDQNTGEQYKLCWNCMRTEKELEDDIKENTDICSN